MRKTTTIGIFFLAMHIIACRSTPGELKREPSETDVTSIEAFPAHTDIHQNRLNMLLNAKPVDAALLIEDFRQATLFFNKQPSQIRPMTIGTQSGILLCRFEESICRVISRPEEFKESVEAPVRRTVLQALETATARNALEIGRALAKTNSNFMSSFPLDDISNRKNAAAMCLGLSQENEELCQDFFLRAAAAYPQLKFAQNIGGMDRDEVQATSSKLSRFKTKDDVVLTKYVGILKQVGKDRLQELAAAERAAQEEERAKATEEAAAERAEQEAAEEERRCNGYAGMPADDFLPIQCIIRECKSSARLGLKVYTACMERCNARSDKWLSCNQDD